MTRRPSVTTGGAFPLVNHLALAGRPSLWDAAGDLPRRWKTRVAGGAQPKGELRWTRTRNRSPLGTQDAGQSESFGRRMAY